MEVTRENTGELTATIKIELTPSDYLEPINKVLKDQQRKAVIPGFRPGHVPFGMIKKMYGSAVFLDEVNKIISEALSTYIQDNNLDVLGQPIPNTDKTSPLDWNEEKNIEFYFDLGLTPEINVVLDNNISLDYYDIKADDSKIEEYITELRERHGKETSPETAGAGDSIYGEFTELDAEGNVKENGIKHSSILKIDSIIDPEIKDEILKLTKDSSVSVNVLKALGSKEETLKLLGIKGENAEIDNTIFTFKASNIYHNDPSELNEEFFEKVYPGAEIKDEEAFREKVKKEAETAYLPNSDHLLSHHIQEKLLTTINIPLPDEFMKRWLLSVNEGKLSSAEIEENYDKYSDQMKWQLIENKIIRENNINVDDDEVKAFVKEYYMPGWQTMALNDDLNDRLESIAKNYLASNKEASRQIVDSIIDRKMAALIKEKVTLNRKSITFDEFLKIDGEKHKEGK